MPFDSVSQKLEMKTPIGEIKLYTINSESKGDDASYGLISLDLTDSSKVSKSKKFKKGGEKCEFHRRTTSKDSSPK